MAESFAARALILLVVGVYHRQSECLFLSDAAQSTARSFACTLAMYTVSGEGRRQKARQRSNYSAAEGFRYGFSL